MSCGLEDRRQDVTERRRFSGWQRNEIFSRAGGRCESCSRQLDIGWHADHWIPRSKGGRTVVSNGRALCPRCNGEKADKVDNVRLRKFQKDLERTTLARIAAGERNTIAQIAPGCGKSLALHNTINSCYREGLIDGAIIGVPRLNLQEQMETDWLNVRDLYVSPRIGKYSARGNVNPLVRADEFGCISTYQSMTVNRGRLLLEWAEERQNRFIFAPDELQFLGADDDGGGTQAANVASQIAAYALMTVGVTGTAYRSDRRRLVFGEYTEPDDKGRIHLISHITPVTYRHGVAAGYLRPFEAVLLTGDGRFDDGTDYDLEALERNIGAASLDRGNWQSLIDAGLEQLRKCKRVHDPYKAVITAVNMEHAAAIDGYITSKHRDLREMLVLSRGVEDASGKIKDFKRLDSPYDIAVGVGMFYVGFDCKAVTVAINVSARRWPGWNDQFSGRADRIWSPGDGGPAVEGQVSWYFGFRDPAHVRWVEQKRNASDLGLRERGDDGGGDGPGPGESVRVIESRITGEAAYGLEQLGDLEPDEMVGIRGLLEGLHAVPTEAAVILRRAGHEVPRPKTPEQRNIEGSQDQRRRLGLEQQDALKQHLTKMHGMHYWEDPKEFGKEISRHTARLNGWQNVPERGGTDHLTEEQWNARLRSIRNATDQGICPW